MSEAKPVLVLQASLGLHKQKPDLKRDPRERQKWVRDRTTLWVVRGQQRSPGESMVVLGLLNI